MQNNPFKKYAAQLLALASAMIIICSIVIVFFNAKSYLNVILKGLAIIKPFIYGFAIAYVLNPIAMAIEGVIKKIIYKNKEGEQRTNGAIRMAAILLSLAIFISALLLLITMIIPEIITSVSRISRELPQLVTQSSQWLDSLDTSGSSHIAVKYLQDSLKTILSNLQSFLSTDLVPQLQRMVPQITSSFLGMLTFLYNFGIGCIIAAYLLGGKERFLAQSKLLLFAIAPEKAANWVLEELRYTDEMFSAFINGKLLDSLIIGVICYIFCVIAQMPYAVLISVLVGVTNVIPFFGPYLGMIPSGLLLLTVSPGKCIIFLIFIMILQQIDGNIIGPAILGDKLGLSGIWILFSILIFSNLWGFVGMLIGVPIFAVIYDLIRRFVVDYLSKKGRQDLLEEYNETFHSEAEKKKQKEKEKKQLGIFKRKGKI